MENEIIIQITSGRGPEECCWVVAQVLKYLLKEAQRNNIHSEVVRRSPSIEAGTLTSALVKLEGKGVESFVNAWTGTILWVGQSPYRKYHKRKNWFVGIDMINSTSFGMWNDNDVIFQTLRSSGPGGQHVNKTESAVRAIHVPSGLQVTASDSRSQLQNKKLAMERLKTKMEDWHLGEIAKTEQSGWQQHNMLERGNPVRVFKGREFAEIRQTKSLII